jgi:hypothetical protein
MKRKGPRAVHESSSSAICEYLGLNAHRIGQVPAASSASRDQGLFMSNVLSACCRNVNMSNLASMAGSTWARFRMVAPQAKRRHVHGQFLED